MGNTLAIEVQERKWLRRKLLFEIFTSDDILDFPEMTQIDDKLKIESAKDGSNILKLKDPLFHI